MAGEADEEGKYSLIRSKFKEQSVLFDLSGFQMVRTEEDLFKSNYSMLTMGQIEKMIDSINTSKVIRIDEFKKNFSTMMEENNVLKPSGENSIDTARGSAGQLNPKGLLSTPVIQGAEKMRTLDMALNLARSKKYYIESLMSEMENFDRPVTTLSVEWHKKLSLSLSCLILFFVGAPLGAIIRKGGLGMPVVVSVVIFILFWVVSITGEKLSLDGAMPPYIGMWIASAITLPIGIFLTSKATSDSSIFDTEAYLNFFKKLLPKKK
jgi:lipopolysaccharide export system permease protein